ncbi:MAG: chorismate mutase [Lactobacillales bacterium]|jgi:monofunctional chorismate mutase|nr:chorismate mutase [Lactobacillales bacterium]
MDEKLAELRQKIDEIDTLLARALVERLDTVAQVGIVKKQNDFEVLDGSREEKVYDNVLAGVNEEHEKFIKEIYDVILSTSRKFQQKIIEE